MGRVGVITGLFVLDWALISVSMFNSLLLLWLGLVVALNAKRRTWGMWLLDGGLMLSTLFFVSHTVILGHELTFFGGQDLEGWWRAGWYPVILAPLTWYVVILWYSGFWENRDSKLHRRHRPILILFGIYTIVLLGLASTRHPVPTYLKVTQLDLSQTISFHGFPLLFILYPPFSLICIALPLDVLGHMVPSQRFMADQARQRARPWLMATSVALLLVVLLLTAFMIWVAYQARARANYLIGIETTRAVAIFDLVLETLIAAAIILLGQGVVSHEIFTGTTLPRRGFFRQWRNTIFLAAAISISVGYALNWQVLPIFSLLLATLFTIGFYALFSWRSFVDREQFMASLRPFVSSERPPSQAPVLFEAICQDVLETRQAQLVPLGVLTPLIGSPLFYPHTEGASAVTLPPDLFADPGNGFVPLDSADHAGLQWAIPLWTERGLIGTLLLGSKSGGGLYTQEEIEIARTSAERILDLLAGEQMAARLMEIQRRRFAETKVLDLRTRRTLHDEILPELHMTALRLSALTDPVAREAIQALARIHHQISDLIHTSSGSFASATQNGIQALRELISDEFSDAFDSITWNAPDDSIKLDPLLQEVLFNAVREVVRNAALHGRGDQPDHRLNLKIDIRQDKNLEIVIRDDGVGMGYRSLAAAQRNGGSGGGLTLHSTMLALAGGELRVSSPAGGGTIVTICVPV